MGIVESPVRKPGEPWRSSLLGTLTESAGEQRPGSSNATDRGVRLTRREIEVLGLIAQGNSSKEAADVLYVSKRTVDFHLANIYDKLQVNNRVQAYRAATRLGLIPFRPVFARAG